MQKERRIRILRRFVLGLAVAALVAPAAQARADELGGGAGSITGAAVTHGESKGDYPAPGGSTVVNHSEYKGDYPAPGGSTVVNHGEYKGDYPAPGGSTVLVHGEYKGDYPAPGGSTVLVHGEYKGDYPAPGDSTGPVVVSTPRTTPVGGLSSPSTFDWGDALVGAGAAFGLMLLAGGSALGMRRRQHPAAA